MQNIVVEIAGRAEAAVLVGYVVEPGGGSAKLSARRAPRDDGEIVVNRVMTQHADIRNGDSYSLVGTSYTASGRSNDTVSRQYYSHTS